MVKANTYLNHHRMIGLVASDGNLNCGRSYINANIYV